MDCQPWYFKTIWLGTLPSSMASTSQTLVELLETLYADQRGQLMAQSNDASDDVEISENVRQDCVLSSCLFRVELQEAMRRRSWRNGLNWQGGLQHQLDLRFADDIPILAATSHRLVQLLDTLIDCLESVDLSLNASNQQSFRRQKPSPQISWEQGESNKLQFLILHVLTHG